MATTAAASSSSRIEVAYTDLAAGLQQLSALPGSQHLVLFTADPDPATGVSWCPDCAGNVPAVRRVAARQGAALLEVLVGPRPVWKDPAHPLRHDPVWRVSGVPTLVKYSAATGAGPRLGAELEAASSPEQAEAIVAAWLDSQQ